MEMSKTNLLPSLFTDQLLYFLHSINRAGSEFYFLLTAWDNFSIFLDNIIQGRTISQHSKLLKDSWNNIISKYGYWAYVFKITVSLTLKCTPQISSKNLSSFIQENLVAFVYRVITEACNSKINKDTYYISLLEIWSNVTCKRITIPGKWRVIRATSFAAELSQDSTSLDAFPSKLLSSSSPTLTIIPQSY